MSGIKWFSVENRVEVFAGIGGLAFAAIINSVTKKPLYAGLHRHLLGGLFGFWVAKVTTFYLRRQYHRRQIYYEDYIRNHPDDFIEPERKKYRDVFGEYHPTR